MASDRAIRIGQLSKRVGGRHRLALGGGAARNGALESDDVVLLTGDLITEAALVTTLVQAGAS